MNALKHFKPQSVFLIIGLVFGLIFLVLNPPFNGNDESVHFLKASDISEAHFMPTIVKDGAGVVVPQGVEYITYEFRYRDPNPKLHINDIIHRLEYYKNYNNQSFVDISNVAIVIYPPVPYFASSVGIALGTLLNCSPLVLLYMANYWAYFCGYSLFIWLLE